MADEAWSAEITTCCATVYGYPWVTWLLGEFWHPGGAALTDEMGYGLELTAHDLLVDVAAGQGSSACRWAERFGCRVRGIDYGDQQVAAARSKVSMAGLDARVTVQRADAERLPLLDATVDAIACECSLCLFPDPGAVLREWRRVLRSTGRVGVADIFRTGPLPEGLDELAAWVSCLGGARSPRGYEHLLALAGFEVVTYQDHRAALTAMVEQIAARVTAWSPLLVRARPGASWDIRRIKQVQEALLKAIEDGRLGYGLWIARFAS